VLLLLLLLQAALRHGPWPCRRCRLRLLLAWPPLLSMLCSLLLLLVKITVLLVSLMLRLQLLLALLWPQLLVLVLPWP